MAAGQFAAGMATQPAHHRIVETCDQHFPCPLILLHDGAAENFQAIRIVVALATPVPVHLVQAAICQRVQTHFSGRFVHLNTHTLAFPQISSGASVSCRNTGWSDTSGHY
jgi:hypothetical protein